MKPNLKQWLSVLCLEMTGVSATGLADVGTPVDCGTVECEAIREMRSLYAAESAYFGAHDVSTLNLATATAKAVTGATEGSILTVTESGQTVITPSYPAWCQ